MVVSVVLAYLAGSIPTAVWWGKRFHGVDIREHGSMNAGATNTFRVLGVRAGVPVLLIDMLKGFVPVRVLPAFSGLEPGTDEWIALRLVLALCTVLGHLYPVFAGFRGGKGIATSFGGVVALHPGVALICFIVFGLVLWTARFVSLASLIAALCFPLAVIFVYREDSILLQYFSVALCLLVFYTHRQNIGRLRRGEENRLTLASRNDDQR
ncbi:MAG: glycerol-3-phosphate 1-O-acyltransferase PlsY [Flavobacteriales bacterium]|nr:glycerol-3-phosphate 1-O-acyltransferase PlsY [Flavobacteriales bacterium]